MKKVFIVLLAACMLFSLEMSATTDCNGYEDKDLTVTITKSMNYPDAAVSDDISGMVIANFRVTDMGDIVIENINATSEVLGDYIFNKLSNLALKMIDENTIGKLLTYKFSFIQE